MRGARTGLTLLEVLVALSILGLGAAALAGMLGQSMHTLRAVQRREIEVQRASAQLARISLWSEEALASRIGRSAIPGFLLTLQPVRASIYSVLIADTLSGAPLLETSLYVGDSSAALAQP